MGKLTRFLTWCVAGLAVASLCFAGQGLRLPGSHGGLGTHTPYVGNQHWGSGGYSSGWRSRPGWNGNRGYRYPGLFAFPFFPVTDWGGYLGDSNPYYEEPAPPPDAYEQGPGPYMGPTMGPYYPPAMPPQDPYAAAQPPPPAAEQQPAEALPPIVLVLHDGQKLQLSNYAVVDAVVWDFSKPVARKIAVSSIDVPASTKATEESGGEFPDLSAQPAPQTR